jgi:hypothetical protein
LILVLVNAMTKLSKWIWLGCGSILVVAGCLAVLFFVLLAPSSNSRDGQNPTRQAEMAAIDIISEWGRLAPFPENAENLLIRAEGNPFTRSFRASFSAPEEEIRTWIAASPGLAEAAVTSTPDGKLKYLISPGGGANYAEVVIDFKSGVVQVYVSWS